MYICVCLYVCVFVLVDRGCMTTNTYIQNIFEIIADVLLILFKLMVNTNFVINVRHQIDSRPTIVAQFPNIRDVTLLTSQTGLFFR